MHQNQPSLDTKRDKEAAIFEAACSVIRDKGFHQARIMDIAGRAGISYGLVYHYFRSKAHLFDAIFREWWSGIWAMMDRCEGLSSPIEEKLGEIAYYFLDLYDKRPDMIHVFITEISRSTANLKPGHLQSFKDFFDRAEKMIARAQSHGELRADVRARYLTYIFLGALEFFLSAMVLENQPLKGRNQKKRIADGVLQVFFNGARRAQS